MQIDPLADPVWRYLFHAGDLALCKPGPYPDDLLKVDDAAMAKASRALKPQLGTPLYTGPTGGACPSGPSQAARAELDGLVRLLQAEGITVRRPTPSGFEQVRAP